MVFFQQKPRSFQKRKVGKELRTQDETLSPMFKRKALNFHSDVDVNIVNHSNLYILLNTCLKSPPAGVVVKQSAV